MGFHNRINKMTILLSECVTFVEMVPEHRERTLQGFV